MAVRIEWIDQHTEISERAHLFEDFAAATQRWLKPQYSSRDAARRAIARVMQQARNISDFHGGVSYRLIDVPE